MNLIDPIGLPKGRAGQFIVDGVADGYEAFALAAIAQEVAPDGPLLFVARDGQRLPAIVEALAFAAPEIPVLEFPAWDCLPYDRVSPASDVSARRLEALDGMISLRGSPHRAIVLATANALNKAAMGRSAKSNHSTALRGGAPSATAPRPTASRWRSTSAPVTPMLARFNNDVAMLKIITVSSFPHTISLRRAGLHSKVSSVPRSFSPAHRSMAG